MNRFPGRKKKLFFFLLLLIAFMFLTPPSPALASGEMVMKKIQLIYFMPITMCILFSFFARGKNRER